MKRVAGVAILALCLASCGKPKPPAPPPDPFGPARTAVRERLTDPRSAQFQRERTSKSAVCGEVNAKNRMGGYVGFQQYLFSTDTKTARISVPPDFSLLTSTMGGNIMDKPIHDAIDQLADQCAFAADAVKLCGLAGPWKAGDSQCRTMDIAGMRQKIDAIPIR